MEICKTSICTGCGVCADVCPQRCISIARDPYGFYKNYVDESRCVKCQRCKAVCPANHPQKPFRIQNAYKARRTDRQAALRSSSGGIASVLSEYVVKSGGVVVGCGYDDNLCLKHSIAVRVEELERFKGSKYLQSDTAGIYRQTREQLRSGNTVLFVGTPCQVSALQNYLGKPYDNLYTVDFVCHGVSSQYVFDKYLESLSSTVPNSIRFRNKTQGYRNKKACFEIQVEYPDKTLRKATEKGVYYWFASALSIRESCYKCRFASVNRAADITLADYVGNDINDVDNEIGVNTVFVNSEKGIALLEAAQKNIVTEPKDLNRMIKAYDHLMLSSYRPSCRTEFFEELSSNDYLTLEEKYDVEKVLPSKMLRRYRAMKRRLRRLFCSVK